MRGWCRLTNPLATSCFNVVYLKNGQPAQSQWNLIISHNFPRLRDHFTGAIPLLHFRDRLALQVEPMYQYSLEWFIDIFLLAIKTAEKPERNLQRRLTAICQEISIEFRS